ncbi:MAG: glycosyltransferase [Clostridia bacterium]|nr:glycosyltransferase [Clostridia bacterium]
MNKYYPFTVLMAVYKNDRPEYFKQAVESVTLKQSIKPDEVVVVVDGPVPQELDCSIRELEELYGLRILRLKDNKGLGVALREGILIASNDIVARMDSDDIAVPNRFELQLSYLVNNPSCDLVGGQISEFIELENNIVGKREVPCYSQDINLYLQARCPFNHMTVMFKKSSVLSAGNYIDWHYNEDYYLWIRMMEAGCEFANLPDTLVNVRVGKDMYARRGGWKYFISEKGLQDYMLKHGIIGLPKYVLNVIIRFGVQVVIPNRLRGFLFQKIFRK